MIPYTDTSFGSQTEQRMGRSRSWPMACSPRPYTSRALCRSELAWYNGPRELTAVGDRVFFSSMAAYWNSNEDWEASGEELWVSDGTELGTRRWKTYIQTRNLANPKELRSVARIGRDPADVHSPSSTLTGQWSRWQGTVESGHRCSVLQL